MAKGVHSKRRKANKSLQRRVIWEAKGKDILQRTSERLMKRTFGTGDDDYITRKKNAFRYPNDPQAIFPKQEAPQYIEKRAAYVPYHLRQNKLKGIKAHKIEENRQKQEIEEALKQAEERFYKKENNLTNNEDVKINLSQGKNINNLLDKELLQLESMNIDEESKSKKKQKMERMTLDEYDDEIQPKNNNKIVRNKKKKKSNSSKHLNN